MEITCVYFRQGKHFLKTAYLCVLGRELSSFQSPLSNRTWDTLGLHLRVWSSPNCFQSIKLCDVEYYVDYSLRVTQTFSSPPAGTEEVVYETDDLKVTAECTPGLDDVSNPRHEYFMDTVKCRKLWANINWCTLCQTPDKWSNYSNHIIRMYYFCGSC